MPWYKAGTVSVAQNSNTVTGTNTSFIANSRVGDAFRGPDGAWYEVTNIASDTAMSISPNYQGVTNAAGGYALAPLQGYVKESADALRSLVNQFGAKLAALGTTGNFDILPVNKGGTGASDGPNALSSLGAQAKSNSLSALSFAGFAADQLPYFTSNSTAGMATFTAFGRSLVDDATPAAARSTLQLGAAALAAVVGAVGQSGGVPTGAIMEYGSNANGSYLRLADGTQICWTRNYTFGPAPANANPISPWTPPQPFAANVSAVFPMLQFPQSNDAAVVQRLSGYQNGGANISIQGNFNISQAYTLAIFAIGRWY
ncbi:phage tail protein [Pseudomonas sp. DOAB1069]|uniref:Phage tail protein n=1 Tax=Pseudomonas folii TaxID=2762593 RepID=A0ABR7AUF7_9PSED|nr:phage tail protein [Pseudomonas folii]MBC3948365.1 phage tail protein [Pseudomonas folii]